MIYQGGGHQFRNKIPFFSPTMLILSFLLDNSLDQSKQSEWSGWSDWLGAQDGDRGDGHGGEMCKS